MSRYEQQYREILSKALYSSTERADRTGVGCRSLFSQNITVDLVEGFPLLTGRKMFPKIFNTEFDWFMAGETNIQRFRDNNVTIWDEWADEDGELGPVYGYQMRNFNGQGIDQLDAVMEALRRNPDSRRHIITLWNPQQLSEMNLPPCYLYFQFFVEAGKRLNMFVVQRSADLFLGVPYDVALFSKLLIHVASETGLSPGLVDVHLVDAHVYSNHRDAVAEYLDQPTYTLPSYTYEDGNLELHDYKCGKVITAKVAV